MFKNIMLAALISGAFIASPAISQAAGSFSKTSKANNMMCQRNPGAKMCMHRHKMGHHMKKMYKM